MIVCPKCKNEFESTTLSGYTKKFCSRYCANSRNHSLDTKNKIGKAILKEWHNKSKEEQQNHINLLNSKEAKIKITETVMEKRNSLLQVYIDTGFGFADLTNKQQREIILKEQNCKCNSCNIDQEWNNKPLKFELDHIDGNKNNNNRTNLRFLCPNCHSQTDTYKVGNNKNPGKIIFSDEQIIESLKISTSGYTAMKSLGMNPHGGNYTRIRKIIDKYKVKLNYTV